MEKYGTVPKKFTKAWWEYIWEYYKWHIIGSVVAAGFIATTAVQCSTKIRYDMTVTYIGGAVCSEETQTIIAEKLEEAVGDVNGNGKKEVFFQPIHISDTEQQVQDMQYEMAMQTKMMMELQAGESFLFLMSPARAEQIFASGSLDGYLLPVSEWYQGELSEEEKDTGDLSGYAVALKNSALLQEAGFDFEEVYLMVRVVRNDESKKEEDQAAAEKEQSASMQAAAMLIDSKE